MAANKVITGTTQTVTTNGTRVQLSSTATTVLSVIVQADGANTGALYVGDSTVSSTDGLQLSPGQSISINAELVGGNSDGFTLTDIYIDSDSNGSKARFAYITRR